MSQLGSFDGYSRRLLNPTAPLNGVSAKRAEAPQTDSQDDVKEASGISDRCAACTPSAVQGCQLVTVPVCMQV